MKKIIITTNWILAGFLSLLGFVSCTEHNAIEYGTPNADYTVKGAVVDKATGKPVKGIRIGYQSVNAVELNYYVPNRYVLTNERGEFKLTENLFSFDPTSVFVEDIDGEENGLFQSEQIQVDFANAERTKKGKSWYSGEFTLNLNVKLAELEDK